MTDRCSVFSLTIARVLVAVAQRGFMGGALRDVTTPLEEQKGGLLTEFLSGKTGQLSDSRLTPVQM